MLALPLAGAGPAAALEPARGATLFEPCRACHSLDAGATGMAGPHLARLRGRAVAGAGTFDYSPALRLGQAAGWVWDEARLDAFLADPDEMFPGLWMSMRGIARAEDRAALVAFLLADRP